MYVHACIYCIYKHHYSHTHTYIHIQICTFFPKCDLSSKDSSATRFQTVSQCFYPASSYYSRSGILVAHHTNSGQQLHSWTHQQLVSAWCQMSLTNPSKFIPLRLFLLSPDAFPPYKGKGIRKIRKQLIFNSRIPENNSSHS